VNLLLFYYGLDLGENYRNVNGCKTFAASIVQTLVDKQVKFQILSYKLGLGKSLSEASMLRSYDTNLVPAQVEIQIWI
jgi:hypothetical protein